MAIGLPVVGTSFAFQGLQPSFSDGIRIADDPAGFARHVVALIRDPELRRECAAQARAYVERHHAWQKTGASLEKLLIEVCDRSPAGAGTVAEESLVLE